MKTGASDRGVRKMYIPDDGQTEMSVIYLAGIEISGHCRGFHIAYKFLIFASQRCIAASGLGSISPQNNRKDAPKQATSKRTQRGHAAKVLQNTFPAHFISPGPLSNCDVLRHSCNLLQPIEPHRIKSVSSLLYLIRTLTAFFAPATYTKNLQATPS